MSMRSVSHRAPCLLQHGTSNRNRIIVRETAHRRGRRIAERRKPTGQGAARRILNVIDQADEHQVEQLDMILTEAARPIEEKCGHALERFGLPLA
jgi:hypothetical protein